MILPNREYPVQVSKPFADLNELDDVIEWMKEKNQDFVVGKAETDKPYTVFRKFDDADHNLVLRNKIPFVKWTRKLLNEREDLYEYKILMTSEHSYLTT